MTPQTVILILSLALHQSFAWEALPNIPSGRRSQFYAISQNGGYKYGYDTGDGSFAKQSGDSANQVSGHFGYTNNLGQNVDLKYTAGVEGYRPEGSASATGAGARSGPFTPVSVAAPAFRAVDTFIPPVASSVDEETSGDATYAFNIDTDTYKRQEASDARGNVRGSYSYTNGAGVHDLTYTAGENTGFVATSGSLATANGLRAGQAVQSYSSLPSQTQTYSGPAASSATNVNTDGSYAFSYSTGDSSRQESADAGNNVQGRYSYQNAAGSHDLSYVAGARTGFLVTGGSLAQPNGLAGARSSSNVVTAYSSGASVPSSSVPSAGSVVAPQTSSDGSYNFQYSTGDQSRQEAADASGNVRGSYSYTNQDGSHDLSYVAGSSTGFLPVGGSLATPNGAAAARSSSSQPVVTSYTSSSSQPVVPSYTSSFSNVPESSEANTGDASYSFDINTDDYQRQETSDASGNVQGRYSYRNAAGTHDLSYVAGSQTGFVATGGSLASPRTAVSSVSSGPSPSAVVVAKSAVPSASSDDQANTGDSSYSFTVDTDEYKRNEVSDAQGNVQGSFSYTNEAGTHDLSYVAGANTGFVATSGSLSDPNAITAKIASLPSAVSRVAAVSPVAAAVGSVADGSSGQSGDASYSFSIDTDDYKRQEVSDPSGNVRGSYSYRNSVGSHDLSYVAGSATGFAPTGGSLATAPGLTESQLRSGQSYVRSGAVGSPLVKTFPSNVVQPAVNALVGPSTKTSYSLDKSSVVHAYLPPSNEKGKFGYIFDTI